MTNEDLSRLVYRRQYLLVPGHINCPFIHLTTRVTEKYTLYTHPDLVINDYKVPEKHLILLGDMFDYENPQKDNKGILKDLSAVSLDALLELSGNFSGRFLLILNDNEQIYLIHDSTATRKVYYSSRKNDLWFASQPHLLARVMGLSKTSNPSKIEFYKSADFSSLNNSNLGDTTYYDEITQLMPNQYFDVKENKTIRYWPSSKIEKLPLEEAVERGAFMVKGYLESIIHRYKVMLPVTAGGDSRMLMAATRDFEKKVLYYINNEAHLSKDNLDIKTPKKLFSTLNMDFNVVTLPSEIDPSFKRIYFENNPYASKFYLPHIYNYYLNFSDRVNLPGNMASSPWGVYYMNKKTVTIEKLTRYYGVHKYDYAKNYYQRWMDDCHKLCETSNLNVINLFYWEERLGNWGTQISLEKDIAQEDFNPLNSRILNELFLAVPLKYNNEPERILQIMITERLWPELMKQPINYSYKKVLLKSLAHLGLFNITGRVYYQLFKNRWAVSELFQKICTWFK